MAKLKKVIKIWALKTINSRDVPSYLNTLSADGIEIFGVYPSLSIGGSYEVLSYTVEKPVEDDL